MIVKGSKDLQAVMLQALQKASEERVEKHEQHSRPRKIQEGHFRTVEQAFFE
jgi:hypothetical protein